MRKLIIKKNGEYVGCIHPDKLDTEFVLSVTAQAVKAGCTVERYIDHVPTLECRHDWPEFESYE